MAGQVPGSGRVASLDETDNDLRTLWADVLGALGLADAVPAANPLSDLAPASAFGAVEIRQVRAGLAQLPGPDPSGAGRSRPCSRSGGAGFAEQRARASGCQAAVGVGGPVRSAAATASGPDPRRFQRDQGPRPGVSPRRSGRVARGQHLEVDDRQVEVLLDRTQGWPAGLRLAALSLAGAEVGVGVDGPSQRFTGKDRLVAAYLIGEVLDRQPAQIRDFLLRTSVLERVSGPLANVLTGRTDGTAVLESLVAANLLVVEVGDGRRLVPLPPPAAGVVGASLLGRTAAGTRPERIWRRRTGSPISVTDRGDPACHRSRRVGLPESTDCRHRGPVGSLAREFSARPPLSSPRRGRPVSRAPAVRRARRAALALSAARLPRHAPGRTRCRNLSRRRTRRHPRSGRGSHRGHRRPFIGGSPPATDCLRPRTTCCRWSTAASPAILPAGRQYRVIALSSLGVGQLTAGRARSGGTDPARGQRRRRRVEHAAAAALGRGASARSST